MKLDLNSSLVDGVTGKPLPDLAYRCLAIILQNTKTSLDIDWSFDNAVKLCANNGVIEISDTEAEKLKITLRNEINQPPYILSQICKAITDTQLLELEAKKKASEPKTEKNIEV